MLGPIVPQTSRRVLCTCGYSPYPCLIVDDVVLVHPQSGGFYKISIGNKVWRQKMSAQTKRRLKHLHELWTLTAGPAMRQINTDGAGFSFQEPCAVGDGGHDQAWKNIHQRPHVVLLHLPIKCAWIKILNLSIVLAAICSSSICCAACHFLPFCLVGPQRVPIF